VDSFFSHFLASVLLVSTQYVLCLDPDGCVKVIQKQTCISSIFISYVLTCFILDGSLSGISFFCQYYTL